MTKHIVFKSMPCAMDHKTYPTTVHCYHVEGMVSCTYVLDNDFGNKRLYLHVVHGKCASAAHLSRAKPKGKQDITLS